MDYKRRNKNSFRVFAEILILFLSIAALAVFLYQLFCVYSKRMIADQLEQLYGVSFEVRSEGVGKTGVYAVDGGAKIYYTTDDSGNITTDSYINCYYADEVVAQIEDEIGECFDECIVVYDCLTTKEYINQDSINGAVIREYNSYDDYTYEFDSNCNLTYKDYCAELSTIHEVTKPIVRVYIRDSVEQSAVESARDILRENSETLVVVFYALSDELYERAKGDGVYCYIYDDYIRNLKFEALIFGSDYSNFVLDKMNYSQIPGVELIKPKSSDS